VDGLVFQIQIEKRRLIAIAHEKPGTYGKIRADACPQQHVLQLLVMSDRWRFLLYSNG